MKYRHWPHDDPDEFHDDLVETLKEVDHHLRLLSHLANDDAERDAEYDNTWTTSRQRVQNIARTSIVAIFIHVYVSA